MNGNLDADFDMIVFSSFTDFDLDLYSPDSLLKRYIS